MLTAFIAMVLMAIIRSKVLAITGTVIITELLVLLWQYRSIGESQDPHLAEVLLVPIQLLIITVPITLTAATVFVVLTARLWRRNTRTSKLDK